jgi:hypothetical protein
MTTLYRSKDDDAVKRITDWSCGFAHARATPAVQRMSQRTAVESSVRL